jgi:hypothetical protein
MVVVATILITSAVSIAALPAQQAGGSMEVPAGARVVLEARGEGVQIYSCAAAQGGFKWVLTGPDARLLDDSGKQIGIHFAGPTWKLTDGSQVAGEPIANMPSPDANSVAWLLLRAKSGNATGRLAAVEFIRRTATHGGVAAAGCETREDVGKTVRVPYTATYTFYSQK